MKNPVLLKYVSVTCNCGLLTDERNCSNWGGALEFVRVVCMAILLGGSPPVPIPVTYSRMLITFQCLYSDLNKAI